MDGVLQNSGWVPLGHLRQHENHEGSYSRTEEHKPHSLLESFQKHQLVYLVRVHG